MIGIAITTYNRKELLNTTLEKIKIFAPDNAIVILVDDGSRSPHPDTTYHFKENQGTPVAKNKCLELLYNAGCNHIFLFDNDCYPIKFGWEKPYIESPEPHLNYTFKYKYEIKNNHKIHNNPNGCMIYIRRNVLEVVGGFDTEYKKYGYFHGDFSNRVYNTGLTSAPFIDVVGSNEFIYSMDEKEKIRTTRNDISLYLSRNRARYNDNIKSKKYHEFRSSPKVFYSNPYSTQKNIGKALNNFCELLPDDAWICLQDGDMQYLTPDWGVQIETVINNFGSKFSLIGCVTNRLGRRIQLADGVDYDNHDMKYHYDKALYFSKNHFGVVEDITDKKYVAGMFMLFPKWVWNRVKFEENNIAFDDAFSKGVLKIGGRIGLMKGLYVYHSYRIWSDTPRGTREHLL